MIRDAYMMNIPTGGLKRVVHPISVYVYDEKLLNVNLKLCHLSVLWNIYSYSSLYMSWVTDSPQ